MELSCRMLFKELAGKYSVIAENMDNPDWKVRAPEFYFKRNILRNECLYVADSLSEVPELAEYPAAYCGCVPAFNKGTWIALEAEAGHVINSVSSIFRRYENWEENLKTTVLNRGTAERLLEISEGIFSSPIYFLNRYFVARASAGEGLLPVSKQILGEEEDPELIAALNHDKIYKQNSNSVKPYFMPARVLPFDSVVMNLVRDGEAYGMLCVVQSDPDEWEKTAELLEVLSVYVNYLYNMEETSGNIKSGPAAVLYEMLSDMSSDYDEAMGRLDAYGWNDEDEYLCACALTEGGKTPVGNPESVCRKVSGTYPGSCAFMMGDRIICYFNLSRIGREKEAFYNEITILIREYYLRTGYSRRIRGKRHLRRQYKQAVYALEKGLSSYPSRWLFRFDEFAPEFLRERVLQSWPPQLLVHPGLEMLIKSDSENSTDYMNTLKVMLDCGMSATAAAEKLFIHRSTLLYRMDKIKSLLGSRLDNPEELTYLSVSFYLIGK